MKLINKSFLAPYYIFVKDNFKLSDNQLLEKLELLDYKLITDQTERMTSGDDMNKRYLYLTEDEKWKHLMDDWFYTLWHDKAFRLRVKNLSKEYDVFCCSVGDADDSFDFVYYHKGVEKRAYVVEDPEFNGGDVVKNIGVPFPIEKIALSKKDQLEKVLAIADSIGININHELIRIRCYGRLEENNEKFFFDVHEY